MDAFYIQFCQKVGKVVIGLFVNSLWFSLVNCSFPYTFFVSNRMNGQKSAMHVLSIYALLFASFKWKVESDATLEKEVKENLDCVRGCRIIAVACSLDSHSTFKFLPTHSSSPLLFSKIGMIMHSSRAALLRAKTQILPNLFTILHPLMQPRNVR